VKWISEGEKLVVEMSGRLTVDYCVAEPLLALEEGGVEIRAGVELVEGGEENRASRRKDVVCIFSLSHCRRQGWVGENGTFVSLMIDD